MQEIQWRTDSDFSIGGVEFQCSLDDYTRKSTRDRIIILKSREVLEQYRGVFADNIPRNALEFGIFQGGSPVLFSIWFGLDKFVGLDICKPIAGFDEFRQRHPVGNRIKVHYEVDQTDRRRVEDIINEEFGETPLDLIVDDASHLYGLTRRSFEIAFPFLRPGGTYVVEDWGWAHWPGSEFFMGKSALSILIMELMMLCASRADLISEIRIFSSFAFIRKAPAAPRLENFNLDSAYTKRGLEIFGEDGQDLGKIARVFGEQLRRQLKHQARRVHRRLVGSTSRP